MAEELKLKEYHDIMNSVSVIKGMAELLIEGEGTLEKKGMLSVIANRAEKVAEQATTLNDSKGN